MKNNTGQQATFDRNSTDHRLGNSRLERLFFLYFLKRFIAQKIQRDTQGYKIVPLTNLP